MFHRRKRQIRRCAIDADIDRCSGAARSQPMRGRRGDPPTSREYPSNSVERDARRVPHRPAESHPRSTGTLRPAIESVDDGIEIRRTGRVSRPFGGVLVSRGYADQRASVGAKGRRQFRRRIRSASCESPAGNGHRAVSNPVPKRPHVAVRPRSKQIRISTLHRDRSRVHRSDARTTCQPVRAAAVGDETFYRHSPNVREVRPGGPIRLVGARKGSNRCAVRRHVVASDAERDDELVRPPVGRSDGSIRRWPWLRRRCGSRRRRLWSWRSAGERQSRGPPAILILRRVFPLPPPNDGVRSNDTTGTGPEEVPAPPCSGRRRTGVLDRNVRFRSLIPERPSLTRRTGMRFQFVADGSNARNWADGNAIRRPDCGVQLARLAAVDEVQECTLRRFVHADVHSRFGGMRGVERFRRRIE
ncbi:hypothetical protein SAMN05444342_0962 [Haladaptatus paucihalophilus DX253]|uniref:Uncharacterized protein n=1 Tax=Haladaptatus paucihalophilus DX253 TaxID=797209 RepID=A0A1M6QLS8_HALPU|nr:hypothetical protein SAMN05444342_0962 [Haladaptatus paucihalophilus DX253]